MVKAWSGRAVEEARAIMAPHLPAPCARCGEIQYVEDKWVVGHKLARSLRPDLTWVVSNWQVECRRCSDASAQAAVIERAKAAGRAEALAEAAAERQAALFPVDGTGGQPPLLPVSPPAALFATDLSKAAPFGTNAALATPRDDLLWDPDTLRGYPWLAEFADVPDDAAPPYAMSLPAPDAVCSYGSPTCEHLPEEIPDCVTWNEKTQKRTKRLRWWQRLAIARQLEHRADGSLCYRNVVESGPRRIGKSVRVRAVALWRMRFGLELFGEPQIIVHTGSDVAICREIQRGAWSWAESIGWVVSRANGKEALEGDDEARWMVRAQDACYGYDVCMAMVDEGWNVKPDTVTEGLEPAMLERLSPQLHATSTAHRRATSLMRTMLIDALTIEDPETLLLLWAAAPDADPGAPATWRSASPHWSKDRERMIARKYEKAAAGQEDPEADDPNPMAGFCAQYLNVWQLRETKARPGDPILEPEEWAELVEPRPDGAPVGAAIEGYPGQGVSAALAWRLGNRVVVTATDHDDLAGAVAEVRSSGFRGRTVVGASLAVDPAVRTLRSEPGKGLTAAAVGDLSRLLREDTLRHDGSVHLADQVTAVRVLDGTDAPRMASKGRADAVKAVVWAAQRVRRPRTQRSAVILTAR